MEINWLFRVTIMEINGLFRVVIMKWDAPSCHDEMGCFKWSSRDGLFRVVFKRWAISSCHQEMGCFELSSSCHQEMGFSSCHQEMGCFELYNFSPCSSFELRVYFNSNALSFCPGANKFLM